MHESVYDWVADQVDQRGLSDAYVLEVGSYNVNGSVRELFTGSYLGTDLREGPGVDLVVNAERLPGTISQGIFDVVVCTETLEHVLRPWRVVENMAYALRKGGTLLVTTRGIGFPVHEYPEDHYRFSLGAVERLCTSAGLSVLESADDPQCPGAFVAAVR
jgi:hypothetical protein